MTEECRFAHGNCITHPTLVDGDKVLEGSPPALCSHAAAARRARLDDVEGARASLYDVINQELRECGSVLQLEFRDDARIAVRALVDLLRAKVAEAETTIKDGRKMYLAQERDYDQLLTKFDNCRAALARRFKARTAQEPHPPDDKQTWHDWLIAESDSENDLLAIRDAQVAALQQEAQTAGEKYTALLEAMAKSQEQVGALRKALENTRNCAKGIMPIHSGKPDEALKLLIISLNDARWTRLFAIYAETDAALAGGREEEKP